MTRLNSFTYLNMSKKPALEQMANSSAILSPWVCALLLLFGVIELSAARNLPYRIEHEQRDTEPRLDQRTLQESEYRLRRSKEDYQRALNEARKYRGLAPTFDDEYGYQRIRAESALQRAQQNLRNQESDLSALHRRYEARQRDLDLDKQRSQYPRLGIG